jgi:hypothetical protein
VRRARILFYARFALFGNFALLGRFFFVPTTSAFAGLADAA